MLEENSENISVIQKLPNQETSPNAELQEDVKTPSLDEDPELKGDFEKSRIVLIDGNINKRRTKLNDAKEVEYKIKVGIEHQALCPDLIPEEERKIELLPERALTMWSPNMDIPDSTLQSYISLSHEKFGYNIEQALAMLFWHKHDMEAAIQDLEHFAPFPDEWTREDKIIFEEALLYHGKNFHRIREVLPDKTIGELIHYYYSWKKKRGRQSGIVRRRRGRPEKRLKTFGSQIEA